MSDTESYSLRKNIYTAILVALFVFASLVVIYFWYRPELLALWSAVQSEDSHPALVLASFLILPVFGFPVSPFLILLGLRFGNILGILLMFGAIPIHLVISYWATRFFLLNWVETLAEKRNLHIPKLPENRRLTFGFVFMAVPGLSYSIKNYLLPLSGISFFQYFLCGWLIQGAMGIPFVVLGNAAFQMSVPLLLGLLGLFFILFVFGKWIRKKYFNIMESNME